MMLHSLISFAIISMCFETVLSTSDCDSYAQYRTVDNGLDCYNGLGQDYHGTKSITLSGRTCQSWSSQKYQKHDWDVNTFYGGVDLTKNYCRNPDGVSGGPWCYTTDRKKRWEYCLQKCQDGFTLSDVTKHPAYKVGKLIQDVLASVVGLHVTPTQVFEVVAAIVDGKKDEPSLWDQIEDQVTAAVRKAISDYHHTSIDNRMKGLKERLQEFRRVGAINLTKRSVADQKLEDYKHLIGSIRIHLHETVNRQEHFFNPTMFKGQLNFNWGIFQLYFSFITHKLLILAMLKTHCDEYQSEYEKQNHRIHDYMPYKASTYIEDIQNYTKTLQKYAGDNGTVVTTAKMMYWNGVSCHTTDFGYYNHRIDCTDFAGNTMVEWYCSNCRIRRAGTGSEFAYRLIAKSLWSSVQLPILKAIRAENIPPEEGKITSFDGKLCNIAFYCDRYDYYLPEKLFPMTKKGGRCSNQCRKTKEHAYRWCYNRVSWSKC